MILSSLWVLSQILKLVLGENRLSMSLSYQVNLSPLGSDTYQIRSKFVSQKKVIPKEKKKKTTSSVEHPFQFFNSPTYFETIINKSWHSSNLLIEKNTSSTKHRTNQVSSNAIVVFKPPESVLSLRKVVNTRIIISDECDKYPLEISIL
jgi:hypothetical protein